MTNYAGGGWFDNLGEQSPSRIPAGFLQGGGQNPLVMNNFFGSGNMATPQMLGTGGSSPSQLQNVMMMLGQMFPNQLGGILPTGGNFSPMGYAQYSQQQADLANVMGAANSIDQQQYAAMLMRLNSHLMGTGNMDAVRSASQTQASAILSVMNNPMVQQMTSSMPEIQGLINMINPMQSTSAMMAQQLYTSTRHLGTSTGDVNAMTQLLAERYQIQTGPDRGLINQTFAHGLNQSEIGEAAGAAFKSFVLDPNQIKGAGTQAQNKFTDTVEKYTAVGSSLRDIFGPQGSITQLFQNLNQMTQGGISQMDPGSLVSMVDRMKVVSMNAGVSLQGMQAVMAQGAMYGSQLGMVGAAGARIGLDAVSLSHGALAGRDQAAVWGQATPNQVANEITSAMFGISGSSEGIAAMGLLRLEDKIRSTGSTFTGGAAKSFAKLQGLTQAIRAGTLSKDDISELENVHGLASWTGDLLGGRQAAVEWLTNQRYNSEYQGEFTRGSLAILRNSAEKETISALGYSSKVQDLARIKGISDMDAGGLVWNALLKGGKSEEARLKSLTGMLSSAGIENAGLAAESLYSTVKGTLWDWNAPGKLGMDLAAAHGDIMGGLEMTDRQIAEEALGRATGLGSAGALGQRMLKALTGDGSSSLDDVVSGFLGAPNKAAREALLQKLGATKQVEGFKTKFGLVKELQALKAKGITTIARDGDLWRRMISTGAIAEEIEGAADDPTIAVLQASLSRGAISDMNSGTLGILNTRRETERMGNLMSGLAYALGDDQSLSAMGDAFEKVYENAFSAGGIRSLSAKADLIRKHRMKDFTVEGYHAELKRIKGLQPDQQKAALKTFKDTWGLATSAFITGVDDKGEFTFDNDGKIPEAKAPESKDISVARAGTIIIQNSGTTAVSGSKVSVSNDGKAPAPGDSPTPEVG